MSTKRVFHKIEWASARVPPTPTHWSRAFAAHRLTIWANGAWLVYMSGEVGSGDSTVLGLSWLYDEPVILGERVAGRCSIVPQLTVLGLLDVLGYISNAVGLLYIHRSTYPTSASFPSMSTH